MESCPAFGSDRFRFIRHSLHGYNIVHILVQTDRITDTRTDRHAHIQRDIHTNRQTTRETHRHTDVRRDGGMKAFRRRDRENRQRRSEHLHLEE